MESNLIYITAGSADEAKKIARELVSVRLAACANIIDKVHSVYWWNGQIQNDKETVLIAKTKKSLVPKLIETVKSLHSDSCPCIVSLPITGGNESFLEWIEKETQP